MVTMHAVPCKHGLIVAHACVITPSMRGTRLSHHDERSCVSIMTEPGESASVRRPSTVPIDALKVETSVCVHLSNSLCQSGDAGASKNYGRQCCSGQQDGMRVPG